MDENPQAGSPESCVLQECTQVTPTHEAHWRKVVVYQRSFKKLMNMLLHSTRPLLGARHNLKFRSKYEWRSVNHRQQWVTPDGVHTNTVECASFMAKKRLKREGNILGSKPGKRSDRVQAIAEKWNGSLKRNGGDVMLRILENLQTHCTCIHL